MRYLSLFSGIEAASAAWHDLGWTPVGFSEIEPFPCAVLAHRFPNVRNYGDVTKYKEWDIKPGSVDVVVGGSPCQAFSVAGLRKGLDDPRGNLTLTYLGVVAHLRPRWVVWENVPGVLSVDGGRVLGAFLGALGQLGYRWAYRVLDAQYLGVPQRRRRIFVVASLGDGAHPGSVLFEPESLRGNPAASRKARKVSATAAGGGTAVGRGIKSAAGQVWPARIAPTLAADFASKFGQNNQHISSGAGLFVPTSFTDSESDFDAHGLQRIVGTLCAADGTKGVGQQYATEGKLVVWRAGDQANSETLVDLAGTLTTNRGQLGGILFQAQSHVAGTLDASYGKGTGTRAGGHEREIIAVCAAPAAQVPYRKSRRAQSTEDNETWIEGDVSNTLNSFDVGDVRTTHAVVQTVCATESVAISFQPGNLTRGTNGKVCGANPSFDVFPALKCDSGDQMPHVVCATGSVTRSQKGATEDGTGRGTLIVPVAFHPTQDPIWSEDRTHALSTGSSGGTASIAVATVVAPTLTATNDPSRSPQSAEITAQVASVHAAAMQVRRLTPTECERLQGFPEGWTDIPYRGKPAADGPRYKALGNSMAVPVMRWIGQRIQLIGGGS